MAALTAAQRHAMPRKDFALPGEHFPIEDKKHARLALSGASRAQHVGNISSAEAATVRRKVHAKFPGIGKKRHDMKPLSSLLRAK